MFCADRRLREPSSLNPEYDEGETGSLDVVNALERIDGGGSSNQTATETPNITRQGLANIHQDEDRRAWYLDGEAEDDRVSAALELVSDV